MKQSGVIKFLSKLMVPIDIPAIADRLDVDPDSVMPPSRERLGRRLEFARREAEGDGLTWIQR